MEVKHACLSLYGMLHRAREGLPDNHAVLMTDLRWPRHIKGGMAEGALGGFPFPQVARHGLLT